MRPVTHISLILLTLLLVSVPAPSGYGGFVDIHPDGWTESSPVCINAGGNVVGYGAAGQGERGFPWSGRRDARQVRDPCGVRVADDS